MTGNSLTDQNDAKQNAIQAFAFVISTAICILAASFFAYSYLADLDEQSRIVLNNTINPNDADVASLVRLAGIGPARAEAMVAYREDFVKVNVGRAFENCTDLQKIKGIGPKTSENICEYLRFN